MNVANSEYSFSHLETPCLDAAFMPKFLGKDFHPRKHVSRRLLWRNERINPPSVKACTGPCMVSIRSLTCKLGPWIGPRNQSQFHFFCRLLSTIYADFSAFCPGLQRKPVKAYLIFKFSASPGREHLSSDDRKKGRLSYFIPQWGLINFSLLVRPSTCEARTSDLPLFFLNHFILAQFAASQRHVPANMV